MTDRRGHPRCIAASVSDSGNGVGLHFLMSQWSGRRSQAASQLPLILCFPLQDLRLKEKMPLIIQHANEHRHKRQAQSFGEAGNVAGPDNVSHCGSLYVDHMDAIITRGMNQQILDLEPKIARHLN